MNEEQEAILLHVLDNVEEAIDTFCTPEEIEKAKHRVVEYVRALVDGTHFLSPGVE